MDPKKNEWKLEVGQRWCFFPIFFKTWKNLWLGSWWCLYLTSFSAGYADFPGLITGLCSLPAPSVIQKFSRKALMNVIAMFRTYPSYMFFLGYNVLKCWRMVAENEIVNRLSFHIPLSQKNVTFLATVPTKHDDLHASPLWKVASYFSRGTGDLAENYPCVYTETTITAEFTLTELFSNACSENPQHIDLQANTHQHINTPRPLGQTLLAEKIRGFSIHQSTCWDFKLTNPRVGHPNS